MRALPFAILMLLALVLQVSIAPVLVATSVRAAPQFPLILAVFVALYARQEAAMIGCWLLGLTMDLATIGQFPGFALAFGLVGFGIVRVRASVFRDHPLSHVFLTLLFGFLANAIVASRVAFSAGLDWRLLAAQPLGVAIYSALLAPCLMPLLTSLRRVMQLPERG
jgi:rod shape-determining protein MreD